MSSSSFDSPLFVRDQRRRYQLATADQILEAARSVVDQRMRRGTLFSDPSVAGRFFRDKLAGLEREVFAAVFLEPMLTVECSGPWWLQQKSRGGVGRQDKRGRHCRARSAPCRVALRRHAVRADSAAHSNKSLWHKAFMRAVRADVRWAALERGHG